MITVPVNRLQPGMIVAEPLFDDNRTIIGTGVVLSDRHISVLKECGFSSVSIVASKEGVIAGIAQGASDQRVKDEDRLYDKIDSIFADMTDDKLMMTISDNAKLFLANKLLD
jgi:hypothetical protein